MKRIVFSSLLLVVIACFCSSFNRPPNVTKSNATVSYFTDWYAIGLWEGYIDNEDNYPYGYRGTTHPLPEDPGEFDSYWEGYADGWEVWDNGQPPPPDPYLQLSDQIKSNTIELIKADNTVLQDRLANE